MFGWYSQYRLVIDNHSEISDESDRCWWNHKCYDAILSYTLTLVANQRKSVFTKFEAFLWIKMSWIPIFSLKLPSKHWCAMMHKWTLDHSRKKRGRGGITTRLPFHYLKRFIPSLIRKITFLRQYSLHFPCQMKWMTNTSKQMVIAILLLWIPVITLTVYYTILSITLKKQNTQETHGPHRSPEK